MRVSPSESPSPEHEAFGDGGAAAERRQPLRRRLGSAEETILMELRRSGGPVPRQLLVRAVQATTRQARRGLDDGAADGRVIQNAESTLSRALRSLESKGLVTRTLSRSTRQIIVSTANPSTPPAWEREARAEEALATRCRAAVSELAELGRRAGRRAAQLRIDRRAPATSDERAADIARWRRVMSPPPVC